MADMKDKIMTMFRSLDSAEYLEHPKDFSSQQLKKQIISFKEDLEKRIGKKLELDDSAQDASFFADLILEEKEVNGAICRFTVRFSNFGLMACLPLEGYEREQEVVSAIKESNFLFVPGEYLDKDYDGVFGDKETVNCWGVRFFDYF